MYKDMFLSLYDLNDNFVLNLENFEEAESFFNMKAYNIMRNINYDIPFRLGKSYVKLYLIPKNKMSNRKRENFIVLSNTNGNITMGESDK